MIHYFAYGSNLHPVRLMQRTPSANLIGAVELSSLRLAFHKKSKDGSGKCNILRADSQSDSVYGAIYELDPAHKSALDHFEGKGSGYTDNLINIRHEEREYTCFTYLAQPSHIVDGLKPYHWYKQLVVLGARYLELPGSYISSIESIESAADPDEQRRKEHDALIEKIIDYR